MWLTVIKMIMILIFCYLIGSHNMRDENQEHQENTEKDKE